MTKSLAFRRYLPAVAGLLAAAAVLEATRFGMGLTPDSAHFIAASRSMTSMKGFSSYDGSPLVMWPPLYPALLGLFGLLGIGPLDAARWINVVSYGAVVAVAVLYLTKNVNRNVVLLAGSSLILLSAPLMGMARFALTETSFVLFAFLSIYWADEFAAGGERRVYFFLSACMAALSCLDKYMGVAVVMTGAFLILYRPGVPVGRRLRKSAVFAAVSLLPLALWLWRDYALTVTLTGKKGIPLSSLTESIFFAMNVVSSWLLPSNVPVKTRMTAAALVPAALLLALGRRAGRPQGLARTRPFFYFVLIYTASLVALSSRAAFDRIDSRLLTPVYLPLTVTGCMVADAVIERRGKSAGGLIMAAIAGLWLIYPLTSVPYFLSHPPPSELNALLSDRQNRELARCIGGRQEKARLYSNAPEAVYLLTGREVSGSPQKCFYGSSTPAPDIRAFREAVSSGNEVCLAWFNDKVEGTAHLYGLRELGAMFELSPLLSGPKGAVYTVQAVNR